MPYEFSAGFRARDTRTAGRTDPGDHLVTFAAYGAAPGALVWASVSPGTRWGEDIGTEVLSLGALTGAAAELVKNYVYAYKVTQTLGVLARLNVGAAATIDVGAGVEPSTASRPPASRVAAATIDVGAGVETAALNADLGVA
jgi:hypothetical protein